MRGPLAFVVLAVTVAGCDRVVGLSMKEPLPDAAPDANPDGPGILCYGSDRDMFVRVCPRDLVPTRSLTTSIDTENCDLVIEKTSTRPAICVLAALNLSVPKDTVVTARGPRALLLLGSESLEIGGTLDAAGHANEVAAPAGSPYERCASKLDGMDGKAGGGGGAGGSFAGAGGAGGPTVDDRIAGMPSGDVPEPTVLRGGCPGGLGGRGDGQGGRGGGAVYLMSGASISIEGFVNVSGGGGFDAPINGGGGGGGSGGTILLDAPMIALRDRSVLALGGGGASGGSTTAPGHHGGDPAETGYALGGAGVGGSGKGGDAVPYDAKTGGLATSGGGGGGGGGNGFIVASSCPISGCSPVVQPSLIVFQ